MFAVFKREFKAYFQSVIGWLFVAALLAMFGLYFYVYNLISKNVNIGNRKKLINGNGFVFGVPGSGKSFFCKCRYFICSCKFSAVA